MKRGKMRYTIPLTTSPYENTRKPIGLKIKVCYKAQNKEATYYKEDVAGQLQAEINAVFAIINRYTQDIVIEHLTDINANEATLLVSLKVNVYGVAGRQLVTLLLNGHEGFTAKG